MEQMAVRRTQDAMNLKNPILAFDSDGKGSSRGIRCYRCGKPDHNLRNCPSPYTPVLAYAPTRSKDGTLNKTLMADTLDVEKSEEEKSEEVSDVIPSGRGPAGGSTLPSEDTVDELSCRPRKRMDFSMA